MLAMRWMAGTRPRNISVWPDRVACAAHGGTSKILAQCRWEPNAPGAVMISNVLGRCRRGARPSGLGASTCRRRDVRVPGSTRQKRREGSGVHRYGRGRSPPLLPRRSSRSTGGQTTAGPPGQGRSGKRRGRRGRSPKSAVGASPLRGGMAHPSGSTTATPEGSCSGSAAVGGRPLGQFLSLAGSPSAVRGLLVQLANRWSASCEADAGSAV
jgi:hypothetical protein